MSLIIAYIGKKGCVMAADKRRIAYFGDKENIDLLEKDLYSGKITSDEELYNRASNLDISLKISDNANKLRDIEDVIVGEVSTKSTKETKRKRVYGTTNGYQMVELIGSEITSRERHQKAIILFGNKKTKELAEKLLNQKWKSSFSLKYMGDIFEEVLSEIAEKNPSIGKKFDVIIKQPKFDPMQAQKHLDEVVDRDVKLLGKFINKLREELIEKNRHIQLATKIITKGPIGVVKSIEGKMAEIQLNSDVQAFDINWKQLAKPNGSVVMFFEDEDVKIGDKVVIKDENLCIDRNNLSLNCDIILCSL